MCGIAGIYFFDGQGPSGLGLIQRMMELAAHRGPDQTGCFEESGSLLGHLRLSIIDLSESGRQPMFYRDRYVLVYNGEIYNYLPLRRELEALGHVFVSQSDSEVLLAAYAQWGPDCQTRLAGMWAFLLYDRRQQTLFVSRDRFGIKPLYYWVSPEGFVALGSEIKQFTGLPGWHPRVNAQRLYDYLNWNLTDHDEQTLFAGVHQLPPGACLTLARPLAPGARLPLRQWYILRPQAFTGDRPTAVKAFGELFGETVREHLQADVPVGSCLSGGLDSSSIVCMIQQLRSQQATPGAQHSFSAVFPGSVLDESGYIEAVVAHCGVTGHQTLCQSELMPELLPRLIWHQDQPTGSASVYVQWQVFALAAAAGIKVMLDGQGADEVLGGYHHYLAHLLTGSLISGDLPAYLALSRSVQGLYGYSSRQTLQWSLNLLLPDWLRQPLRRRLGHAGLEPDWLDSSRFGIVPADPYQALTAAAGDSTAASRIDLCHTRLPMLLHWEDRNSMAHGIEARVPFLDHRLVEFALGLPAEIRLHQGLSKYVLREAMAPLLPDAVNQRRDKLGFEPPEADWLRQLPAAWLRGCIETAYQRGNGLLRPAMRAQAEAMIKGEKPYNSLLWRWLNLGLWLERYDLAL